MNFSKFFVHSTFCYELSWNAGNLIPGWIFELNSYETKLQPTELHYFPTGIIFHPWKDNNEVRRLHQNMIIKQLSNLSILKFSICIINKSTKCLYDKNMLFSNFKPELDCFKSQCLYFYLKWHQLSYICCFYRF